VLCLALAEGFHLVPPSSPIHGRYALRHRGRVTASDAKAQPHWRPRAVHAPTPHMTAVASDVYLEQIEAADLSGFRDTAAFFVTAFWDDYKAEVALQGDVLKRVGTEQYVDMKNRYGQLKALPATMIVAKNQQGVIVGCAGVEIALLNEDKIMPKTRANLEQGYDLQALLANVAVSPDYRGLGIARQLCLACEEQVLDWGYDSLLLLVEAENTPAVTLYKRMGFREIFRDNEAKASKAVAYGRSANLKTIQVCTVGMCKPVRAAGSMGGIGGAKGLFGLGILGL